jgi:NADP-dependent 3-hydroxy acid dehydrogenase YdfG
MMSGSLSGRVALVTGASSGIGEAAAIALANAGAHVAISARRADRLNELVKKIEAVGVKGLALPGDIADDKAAFAAVADTVSKFGRLDILINSAGIIQAGNVENADIDEWRRVFEVNLFGSLCTSKAAIPHMRALGHGDIINITSTSARRAANRFLSYSASKFSLNAMTEGMRQVVCTEGIRVCAIEPGATATEVSEGISDPKQREIIRAHINKGGAMKSEDVAAAIMFVLTLPPNVNIPQLQIRPTIDTTPI